MKIIKIDGEYYDEDTMIRCSYCFKLLKAKDYNHKTYDYEDHCHMRKDKDRCIKCEQKLG